LANQAPVSNNETRSADRSLPGEDQARASIYRLLATLLSAPPGADLLALVSQLRGDPTTPLGQAVNDVASAAQSADPCALADEYQALFIGLGRGEILPYGSYYLTGFLHEKPLGRLRGDLARLGIDRSRDVKEPEDHISFVFEVMARLIETGASADQPTAATAMRIDTGGTNDDAPLDAPAFFNRHVAPWAHHLMGDLKDAKSAQFYRAVAELGRAFLDVETQAGGMAN